MSLVNYAYHSAPTDHHDVLAKLKTFAETTCSWTVDYNYNNNIEWGGAGVGWQAGSESHYQFYSTGYGNQKLIARLKGEAEGTLSQHEWLYICGIEPDTSPRTPDTSSGSDPIDQDEWNHLRYKRLSVSPGTMHACWFFGTSKYIHAIIAIDSSFCVSFHFGSCELFKSNDKGIYFANPGLYTDTNNYWYNAWANPNDWRMVPYYAGTGTYPALWDANDNSAHPTYKQSMHPNDGTPAFASTIDALKLNTWTGKRILIKPIVFMQRKSDSVYYPLGTWPFYYLDYTGLSMGDTLTYGTEEYMVFPDVFNTRQYGIAFRIA
jgi:hypothetical protein